MTRHCIFDFDGTLADTSVGIIRTLQQTLQIMGLPPVDDDRIRQTIGLPLSESVRIGGKVPDDRVNEGVETYRRIFFDVATEHIKLFPGVKETLDELHSRGIGLSIATSRGQNSLIKILENYGLQNHFLQMATSNGDYKPKPAPDMVLYLLGKLGANADETIVIGDTTFDLLMGSGAGCRTCGVTWGNHTREKLLTASPDFIIDQMPELIQLTQQ